MGRVCFESWEMLQRELFSAMSLEKIVSGFHSKQGGEKELNLIHWLLHSAQGFTLRLAKALPNWECKQILKHQSGVLPVASHGFFNLVFSLSVLVLLGCLLREIGKQLYQSQVFNICSTECLTWTMHCVNYLCSFCHLPSSSNLKPVLASEVFRSQPLVIPIINYNKYLFIGK